MASSFEALVPDRPDSTRFCRHEEYDLVFCDRVARGVTTRGVLSCEQRHPSIFGNEPPALHSGGGRSKSHDFAMGRCERVAVRTLETIIRRVYWKREAILPRHSFGNTGLTTQQPVRRVALCMVVREHDLPCPRHRTREHSPK
jgi:hypothetical protein